MVRAKDRQKYILDSARELGFVSISDAARHLDTSIETIRRDINKLNSQGLIEKVRGGAAPAKLTLRKDPNYTHRISHNKEERSSIAKIASLFIKDNSVVALDSGVSVQPIATAIDGVKNVTFITNSIPTATILLHRIDAGEIDGRVIIIGGEINTQNRCTCGASIIREIERYYFDISFISCTSLSEDGASMYRLDEAAFAAKLMDRSNESILLAENEKIDKNSFYTYAKISDFSKIITDKHKLGIKLEKAIKDSNVELIIAKHDY